MRKAWVDYFMDIAREVATRATCTRKKVGCVIVRDKRILATGYNGSVRGGDHCDDVGCLVIDNHCVRTVHAEQNAICQAAASGCSIQGAKAIVTVKPCWNCLKLLANAGIEAVVYDESYGGEYPSDEPIPIGQLDWARQWIHQP